MTRERILLVLEDLPLWCWPIFFWDLARVHIWMRTLPEEVRGLFTLAVMRNGQIMVVDFLQADRPDPADWTRYVPRAPWAALDIDCLARSFQALWRLASQVSARMPHQTRSAAQPLPAILDSG
jgi:hypothetical protein